MGWYSIEYFVKDKIKDTIIIKLILISATGQSAGNVYIHFWGDTTLLSLSTF